MSVFAERIHRTSRHRRCDSCDGPIPAGARYRYWVGTLYGTFTVGGECARCAKRYGRPIPPEEAAWRASKTISKTVTDDASFAAAKAILSVFDPARSWDQLGEVDREDFLEAGRAAVLAAAVGFPEVHRG